MTITVNLTLSDKLEETLREYARIQTGGNVDEFVGQIVEKQLDPVSFWNKKLKPNEEEP